MYKEKGVFAFCHTYPVGHMPFPFLADRFSVLDTLGGVDSVIEGTKAEDRYETKGWHIQIIMSAYGSENWKRKGSETVIAFLVQGEIASKEEEE